MSCKMPGWRKEGQAESLPAQDCRGNVNNLRYADDTTLMEESEEELKRLFMKVKEETEYHDLCGLLLLFLSFSQLLHCILSLSSRGSLVSLCFLP